MKAKHEHLLSLQAVTLKMSVICPMQQLSAFFFFVCFLVGHMPRVANVLNIR